MTDSYIMHHVDLTVPEVLNSGHPSHYVEAIRLGLLGMGYSGWTETRGEGAWKGTIERVTLFTLYALVAQFGAYTVEDIGDMARRIMHDQEAIQLVDHGEVTLTEA